MLAGGCKASVNMPLYASVPNWIEKLCAEAIEENPYPLEFVPDHLKT